MINFRSFSDTKSNTHCHKSDWKWSNYDHIFRNMTVSATFWSENDLFWSNISACVYLWSNPELLPFFHTLSGVTFLFRKWRKYSEKFTFHVQKLQTECCFLVFFIMKNDVKKLHAVWSLCFSQLKISDYRFFQIFQKSRKIEKIGYFSQEKAGDFLKNLPYCRKTPKTFIYLHKQMPSQNLKNRHFWKPWPLIGQIQILLFFRPFFKHKLQTACSFLC